MCKSSTFIIRKNFNLEDELEINNGEAQKNDLNKIELERSVRLVDFCRGLLCGLKVGKQ